LSPSPTFFSTLPAPPVIYSLPLHDALPISALRFEVVGCDFYDLLGVPYCHSEPAKFFGDRIGNSLRQLEQHPGIHIEDSQPKKADRKSTRLNSSHVKISYAVFCLKKKRIFL